MYFAARRKGYDPVGVHVKCKWDINLDIKFLNESQTTSANMCSAQETEPNHLSRILLSKIGAFFKTISYYTACLFVLVIVPFTFDFYYTISNIPPRHDPDRIVKSEIHSVMADQADHHATYKTFAISLRELKLKGLGLYIDDEVNLEIIPIDDNSIKIVAYHNNSENGFLYDSSTSANIDESYIKISALEADIMISEVQEKL